MKQITKIAIAVIAIILLSYSGCEGYQYYLKKEFERTSAIAALEQKITDKENQIAADVLTASISIR